jgi:uncharacterized protein (TIGR03545 family)
MRDWIRWRCVLPRVGGIIVVATIAQLGLSPFVGWLVVESGERTVRARVEVGETHVSLLGGDVVLRDIRVANARAPMRNLVEADRCELNMEARALLHKQAIVDHATLTGLRFGTPRNTSGALPDTEPSEQSRPTGWLDDKAKDVAKQWLENLHGRLQQNLVDQLQSVQLTEDLLRRWPANYDELKDRVAELRQQTTSLQTQARAAQDNPLRHVDALAELPKQVAEISENVTSLSKEVEALPEMAEADRRAIVAAREHDERFIRDQLLFDAIDSSVLTAYLMQEQLAGPVADLLDWMQWVRRIVPASAEPTEAKRRRGQEVCFAGCLRHPDVLIRALDLRGSGRLGGQSFELAGTLTDVSNRPALCGQPIRLKLTTSGSLQIQAQATIDRTGPVAKDQFLLDCGGIVLPKLRLGSSDKLRLSISPSTATLNISVVLEGDKLSGDVQLVQKQVKIMPSVGEELDRFQVGDALEESLRDVRSVATRVSLSGTFDRPQFELWSNLGPAVAEAMNHTIQKAASTYARQALVESQQRVDEKLAELDRQIADEQASLKPQLTASTDALKQLVGGRNGDTKNRLSLEQFGQQLPANSLFR